MCIHLATNCTELFKICTKHASVLGLTQLYKRLAGAPGFGGLTCYIRRILRQAVEHQLHMHGVLS